jgi:cholesterol oxidase
MAFDYDFVIVGSGFGGSTAALRLLEKGYRVLMLEKGKQWRPEEFPHTNWDLRRYLWAPRLGCRGIFSMTFLRHVTILSGVGVGGGSLGYACTHPVPKESFFGAASWRHLADWKHELAPHYVTAKRMLGVTDTPMLTPADVILKKMAAQDGKPDAWEPTSVAIYFGKPGETVDDPFFAGEGPRRTGCIRCGGCMLGCRHGAKNTLEQNYLYFARKRGLEIRAETEVQAVRALPDGGYRIEAQCEGEAMSWTAEQVVLAGGVIGTVDLLLRMREDPEGLPRLSPRVGHGVRTNNEALIGVVSQKRDVDFSKGIAISSIYQTDEHSHIEPVRYGDGSGAMRLLAGPHVGGANAFIRLVRLVGVCLRHPVRVLRALLVRNHARATTILLYMRTLEGTLRLRRNLWGRLTTALEMGPRPRASIPEATALANRYASEADGIPFCLFTETLFNIPTTAHILGGACMGATADEGVIDADHRVHGYEGLWVMDGSAVSANPGVNPSLTIVAMTERAMAKIPAKLSA